MNNGKEVCKRLKQVRRDIADANHIQLVQEECTHEGDCMGTCPRCEQEVRYLTEQLSTRRRLGKAVSIIGIAAVTGTIALTSCNSIPQGEPYDPALEGDPVVEQPDTIPSDTVPNYITTGFIAPE